MASVSDVRKPMQMIPCNIITCFYGGSVKCLCACHAPTSINIGGCMACTKAFHFNPCTIMAVISTLTCIARAITGHTRTSKSILITAIIVLGSV